MPKIFFDENTSSETTSPEGMLPINTQNENAAPEVNLSNENNEYIDSSSNLDSNNEKMIFQLKAPIQT